MEESYTDDKCGQIPDAGQAAPDPVASLPACCGTGCAVCVLDYPEIFLDQHSGILAGNLAPDSEMLAMLQAFETAQKDAAGPDNKT
jgi:hypothetical protein